MSLCRGAKRTVVFLRVLGSDATDHQVSQAKRALEHQAEDTGTAHSEIHVERSDDFIACVAAHAKGCDLMVVGLQRGDGGRRVFGATAPKLVAAAPCASVVIQSAR